MYKVLKILAYALSIIAIILAAMIASGNEGQSGSMLFVGYITLAIVLVAVVVFTLVNTFANPANLKRTLINLGAFLLLAIICYAMATGTETPLKDGGTLSAGASKMVGAGLYLFYFLIVLAVGTMLFNGIKKMIK